MRPPALLPFSLEQGFLLETQARDVDFIPEKLNSHSWKTDIDTLESGGWLLTK
jgi:hypothetical protein